MQQWPEYAPEPVKKPAEQSNSSKKYELVRYRIRPIGDFVNTRGEVVPLYGCSFADLDEFIERIDFMRQTVQESPDDLSLEQLMKTDPLFRYSAERCLEMHGLSLADVGIRQMVDLLLYEVVDGELAPGLLVRLNMPRSQEEIDKATSAAMGLDPEQASYERALAIMASHTSSVEEAIRLTNMLTVQQLTNLMTESAKVAKAANGATTPGSKMDKDKLLKYLDADVGQLVDASILGSGF